MMDFELKLTRTTYREAMVEGVVMAASYGLGKPCVVHLAYLGRLTFIRIQFRVQLSTISRSVLDQFSTSSRPVPGSVLDQFQEQFQEQF